MAAENARNAVVPSQPLVEKRVVRAKQVLDRPVLAQLALEEQLGFAGHCIPERRVELELLRGLLRAEIANLQPLSGKVIEEAFRPGVCEHPAHLLQQHVPITQLQALGDLQQLLVWNALPEEEGQT